MQSSENWEICFYKFGSEINRETDPELNCLKATTLLMVFSVNIHTPPSANVNVFDLQGLPRTFQGVLRNMQYLLCIAFLKLEQLQNVSGHTKNFYVIRLKQKCHETTLTLCKIP